MAYENILYEGRLEVNRRSTTWLAKRCIAHWSNRDRQTFQAMTPLSTLRPDVAALRNLIPRVFQRQQGYEGFDAVKFTAAWTAWTRERGEIVDAVYHAVWQALN